MPSPGDSQERFPVVWPYGTRWQPQPPAVVLGDGTVIPLDAAWSASGGYHDSLDGFADSEIAADHVARCVDNTFGEIAIVQSQIVTAGSAG